MLYDAISGCQGCLREGVDGRASMKCVKVDMAAEGYVEHAEAELVDGG